MLQISVDRAPGPNYTVLVGIIWAAYEHHRFDISTRLQANASPFANGADWNRRYGSAGAGLSRVQPRVLLEASRLTQATRNRSHLRHHPAIVLRAGIERIGLWTLRFRRSTIDRSRVAFHNLRRPFNRKQRCNRQTKPAAGHGPPHPCRLENRRCKPAFGITLPSNPHPFNLIRPSCLLILLKSSMTQSTGGYPACSQLR